MQIKRVNKVGIQKAAKGIMMCKLKVQMDKEGHYDVLFNVRVDVKGGIMMCKLNR